MSKLQDELVGLFENGMSPPDIMKHAMKRTEEAVQRHEEIRHGNILILNLDQRQMDRTHLNLNGVIWQHNFRLERFPFVLRYGCWVFESGTVDHQDAEGGWTNWSMCGRYERSGRGNGLVQFFPRRPLA